MIRTIHLHGKLKEIFGAEHRLDVATAGEALRALNTNYPQFANELREGYYQIIRGRQQDGMAIELDFINSFKLGSADLHVIPVAEGAKSGHGTVKLVAGVALVGAAVFLSGGTLAAPLGGLGGAIPGIGTLIPGVTMTWGNLAVLGLGLTLAGAASMLSKPPATEQSSRSFTFSGPVNTNAQGDAIPVIYGQVICGSQPISSGFDIEPTAEG
jgi:predicted phage tail protein